MAVEPVVELQAQAVARPIRVLFVQGSQIRLPDPLMAGMAVMGIHLPAAAAAALAVITTPLVLLLLRT